MNYPLGMLDQTSSTETITLNLVGQGAFPSTVQAAATAGEATFSSCNVEGSGSFVIQATSSSSTEAYSDTFTLTSGTPAAITYKTVVDTVYRGVPVDISVEVTDSNGYFVNTGEVVTLIVDSGPGALVAGFSATLDDPVTTFTGVTFSRAGAYSLQLSCATCPSTALSLDVEVGAEVVVNFSAPAVEGLTGQSYQISLSEQPSANVEVAITSLDPSVLQVATSTLTFTSGNYNVPQTVGFNVASFAASSNPLDVVVAHNFASTDWKFNGVAEMQACMWDGSSFTVPIYGTAEYSIEVTTIVGVKVSEAVSVTITLGTAPANDVVLNLTPTADITLSASSLTFTSGSWTAQTITVTAPTSVAGDFELESITYAVSTTDPNYSTPIWRPASQQTHVVVTTESPAELLLEKSHLLMKTAHFDQYHVSLGLEPTATVTVNLTPASGLTVSPTSLTFAADDYFIPQRVSVYADSSSTTDLTITHALSSSDSNYSGNTVLTVIVAGTCDDPPYAWPGPDSCDCPNGFNCEGREPEPCPAGWYNSSAAKKCTICPAGSSCADPTASPQACNTGFYSYEGQTHCLPCPGGYVCNNKTGLEIQRCTPGTRSEAGSSNCLSPTNVAPSTSFNFDMPIPSGGLIVGTPDFYMPCPAGHSCSGSTVTRCSAGEYSLEGMGSCMTCPDHVECDIFAGPLRPCPEGTQSPAGQNMCSACPADSYCTEGQSTRPASCTGAPEGSYECSSSVGADIYEDYPGLKDSSGTLTECTETGADFPDCFVKEYSTYKDHVRCEAGWGICYPTPGGMLSDGSLLTGNEFSYIGVGTGVSGILGYRLPDYADQGFMTGFECRAGHYCDNSGETACAAGKYNPFVRATSSTYCQDCPPGYLCSTTGIGNLEHYPCPMGNYCTEGSDTASQCSARTYYNKLRALNSGHCMQCYEGYYCGEGTVNPAMCARGRICPIGSSEEINCPAGTYNSFEAKYKIEDCLDCPYGHYCPEGSAYPRPCAPGTYNPYLKASDPKNCMACTPGYACVGYGTVKPYVKCKLGYYCPRGSNIPVQNACPPGTIALAYGLFSISQCDRCPAGFACGYASNYADSDFDPVECPVGYYCPQGTTHKFEFPCPAGTYSVKTRRENKKECLSCPPGKFCPKASSTLTASNDCPVGHYCPLGTTYNEQYPCPAGTFRDTAGAINERECALCSVGKYCPPGSSAEVNCPAGTYMDELGAQSAGPGDFPNCKPCRAGTYSGSAGATTCTKATAGSYTRKGATAEETCEAGYFCANDETSEYIMYHSPCPAGYTCTAGMSTYPTFAANACPAGEYCIEASSSGVDCPAGTFRNKTGAKSIYECEIVPAGYYTDTPGSSTYSECDVGHYCPEGSTSNQQKKCPAGTYREKTGGGSAADCATCKAGRYCPTEGMSTTTECPRGKFCPAGTIEPLLCPRGSYGAAVDLSSSSDCTLCDAGKYCDSPGKITTTADCEAGFYCIRGAYVATPQDGETGNLCPQGGYCTAGVTSPEPCPDGQFNNFEGGRSDSDCVDCWPGYYCQSSNNPEPTGQCAAGHYCEEGSPSATQNQVTQGNYAPVGSVAPIPCPFGTYGTTDGQASCTDCPAGDYCKGASLTTSTPCDEGFYCVLGSFVPIPCPAGRYRAAVGAISVDECTACDPLKYCDTYGSDAVIGDCDAGYYCTSGSPYKQPKDEVSGNYGPCPQGYYCDGTSATPVLCPVGTYNPTTHARAVGDCLPCWAGYACPNLGQKTVTLQCKKGYYCPEGSSTDQPAGTICSTGHYCPVGSGIELKCAAGTYQGEEGSESCRTCTAGYYCEAGAIEPDPCPAGYYCPAGTKHPYQYPCAPGTYNPNEGQLTIASCFTCSPGSYCAEYGASAVTGACAAGYYCTSGSTTPRPTNSSSVGGRCGPGFYCPGGSSSKISCDAGHYCPNDEMEAVGPQCEAGYYCISEAITPTPTDGTTGNICPEQYYCIAGGSSQTRCGSGTYLPYQGGSSSSECIPCTPGYYCNGSDSNPIQQCTAGFYCPGKADSASTIGDITPTDTCPLGHKCPTGSAAPTKCPAGTYQDTTKQADCKDCREGYFCQESAQTETICPKGYYCPANTGYQLENPCPIGTYNNLLGQTSSAACKTCDAGSYCSQLGATLPTGSCSAGYYCLAGCKSARPTVTAEGGRCDPGYYCPTGSTGKIDCDPGSYCASYLLAAVTGRCAQGYYCVTRSTSATPSAGTAIGDICPAGSYCKEGTSTPSLCPQGTYSDETGLGDLSECFDCPPGEYCPSDGMTSTSGQCTQGFVCSGGSFSATPSSGICPIGHYCPTGTIIEIPCDMGYYNLLQQQATCTQCDQGYACSGGTASAIKCDEGYACPAGTRFTQEFPCEEGYYNDSKGQGSCTICPAGFECRNAATSATSKCPQYYYCEEGTGYGNICAAGTYNSDNEGLDEASDCTTCPPGQYCVDGRISGQCEAGYYCSSGSPTAVPVDEPDGTVTYGDYCWPGYYCPRGATTPTQCPTGKFRSDEGGRQENDCTECSPGFYCITGNPVPVACTAGHYCPQGVNSPIECPNYQYNPNTGQSDNDACQICPEGYLCNSTGISDLSLYPCTTGNFCVVGATDPIPCPPGTYNTMTNAGAPDQCRPCPGGNYCIGGEDRYYPCGVGTYCPEGSSYYLDCIPGYLCGEMTENPVRCEAGQYCPLYDKSDLSQYTNSTEPPINCPDDTWCPGGNFYPGTCRAGSELSNNACVSCPEGKYSDGFGNSCRDCDAGYICTGGATTATPTNPDEGGYPCPAGYYCPTPVPPEIACPITTYNNQLRATGLADCLPCPAGTYGDTIALTGCSLCGSYATSQPGESTCTCEGAYRMYQKHDGSCVCLSGYFAIVEDKDNSQVDSDVNCIPEAYEECLSGTVRTAGGNCKDSSDCESECGGAGSIIDNGGVCQCDDAQEPDAICGASCRDDLPRVYIGLSGSIEIQSASGQVKEISLSGQLSIKSTECTKTTCNVASVEMTTNGVGGVHGVPASLQTAYVSRGLLEEERRELSVSLSSTSVDNPMVCITEGDAVIFSLQPKQHYPVYVRDSLLNTNSDFDYSAFQELEWRMQNQVSQVETFAFTFTTPGVYDFVDAYYTDRHLIIVVVSTSESCTTSSGQVFLARTSTSFSVLGVGIKGNLLEDTPLTEVILIIIGAFITIMLCIGLLAFLHWRAWATEHAKERLYAMIKNCIKRCSWMRPPLVHPDSPNEADDLGEMDYAMLEPSQFTKMMKKIEQFYEKVAESLDNQDEDTKAMLEELQEDARFLQELLRDKLSVIDPVLLKQKLVEPDKSPSTSEDERSEEIADARLSVMETQQIHEQLENYFAEEPPETDPEQIIKDIGKGIDDSQKEELLSDFHANNQRIDQLLEQDRNEAQEFLRRRLEQRAARRKAAKNEHAMYDKKQEEMRLKHTQDRRQLEREHEEARDNVNREIAEEKEAVKAQNRKELNAKMDEVRTQLQHDMTRARSQQEIDDLMASFEIERKRVEDQLYASKKAQEEELLKRLEERRRNRIAKLDNDYEARRQELEDSQREQQYQLEQRAMVGSSKEAEGELDLAPETQLELNRVAVENQRELEALREHQAAELERIDSVVDKEIEADRLRRREELTQAIQRASDDDERQKLIQELEKGDAAVSAELAGQSEALRQRLEARKRRRAEKEASMKEKHQQQRWELENQLQQTEQQTRSDLQLKKIEEELEAAEKMSPAELTGLARRLLESKHDTEIAELAAWKLQKAKERQQEILAEALKAKGERKAEIKARYAAQREAQGASDDLIAGEVKELEQEDYEFMNKLNKQNEQALRELEENYRQKFDTLTEGQMREITETLRKIRGADPRLINANMADMEEEINRAQDEFNRNHAEKLHMLDERAKEHERAEKKKQKEIADIQKQIKEVEENQRKLEEIGKKKREMEDQQRMVMEAMKERGISQEKIDEMLKKHAEEMKEWEDTMEEERQRQKKRLQDKLELRKQKYQEKIATQIKKYKEENLRLIEQQEEAERNRLKIVLDLGREVKLFEPKFDIETAMHVPEIQKIAEVSDNNVLEQILQRVRRVEGIVDNIDARQFQQLMNAFKEVHTSIEKLQKR